MRIIAGELKGRRIEAPDWPGLRPTSDKLRETLFNVLAPRIAGVRLLDAYAGTGAVGLEALSRGAAHVTFVERDPRAVRLIRQNVERCGVANRCAIIRAGFGDARWLRANAGEGSGWDLVFLDPPYGAGELEAALAAAERVTGPDTLLVVEHARRDAAPERKGALVRIRSIAAGDSALAFFRRLEATGPTGEPAAGARPDGRSSGPKDRA